MERRVLLTAITSGQTLTGSIAAAGNSYSYSFSANAGDTFLVSLGDVSPASSVNKFDPNLQVLDPNNKVVINSFSGNGVTGDSAGGEYTVPATAVGPYTIVVSDYRSTAAGGAYAVELIKVPGGISSDADGDGGAIQSGQTKTGTINRVGDLDAFTFTANAGDVFEASVGDVTPASSTSNFDPDLQIFDPSGNRVIYSFSGNGVAGDSVSGQYPVPATAVGTYTIVIQDYRNANSGGLYALELVKVPGGITTDSNGDGGAIISGQTKTGTINRYGDLDAFTFAGNAGDTFEVSLGDVSLASSFNKFDPNLQVFDSNGKTVIAQASGNGVTNDSVSGEYTVPATAVGTYTILVQDNRNAGSGGAYAVELIKVPGGIANDADGDGGAIISGQTRTGTINRYGDIDAFTFSANAGDSFEASLSDISPASSLNKYDPYMQVFDPSGNRLIYPFSGNGVTGDSVSGLINVPATAAGTYTIVIQDYRNNYSGGLYALELIKIPGTTIPDSDGDSGTLASGVPRTGTVNRYGDFDQYTFSTKAGDTFEMSLGDVSPVSSVNQFDPNLQVFDPNGNSVISARSGNGVTGDAVYGTYTVPATAVGTYTVVVHDDRNNYQGGLYAVEMIRIPGAIAPDADGDGGALTSGQTKTGTINRQGELDAYSFFAAAGDSVTLSSVINGSNFTALFTVYTPSGGVLKTASSASSLSISAQGLTAGGTYTVIVQNLNASGMGAYTVTFNDSAGTHNPSWLAPDSGAGYTLANNTLAISSGAVSIVGDPTSTNSNLNVVVTGSGKLYLDASTHLGSLTLSNTSSAMVAYSSGFVESMTALSIATGATIDITNSKFIIDYSGASPISTIRGYLTSGRNTGNWDGLTGIISSSVRSIPFSSLAYAEASDVLGPAGGSFEGQAVDGTAILIRSTYLGDTTLNGKVDGSDYTRIDSGFITRATGWDNGDLNYDGVINGSDYTLIDNAFNNQGASYTSQIAEVEKRKDTLVPVPTTGQSTTDETSLIHRRKKPRLFFAD